MNKEPTKRMLLARDLRIKGKLLSEIGSILKPEKPITKQGVRFILLCCDKFMAEEDKIGSRKHLSNYRKRLNAREQSAQSLQEKKS